METCGSSDWTAKRSGKTVQVVSALEAVKARQVVGIKRTSRKERVSRYNLKRKGEMTG